MSLVNEVDKIRSNAELRGDGIEYALTELKKLPKDGDAGITTQGAEKFKQAVLNAEQEINSLPPMMEPDDRSPADVMYFLYRTLMKIVKVNKRKTRPGGTRAYRKKFDRCVKTVRKSIKPRKGSTKESAAIAICTKSVLQTRGRTMKKYRKGKLTTQNLRQ